MEVTCALFGPLRDAVETKEIPLKLDGPLSVDQVLEELRDVHPELDEHIFDDDGNIRSVNITLDGRNIQQLDGLETSVTSESIIRIAPPVTGGTGVELFRD